MNNYMETIQHSIRQTKDCQEMANKAIKWNYELIKYIELLKKENESLKQKLAMEGRKTL